MQKTVPIIIVTYNQVHKFTIPCIESIIKNTGQPYKVVIIDNASEDDTPAILRSRFESIDIIGSRENLGWDGGNLLGIEHIDRHYEYDNFCLLNSDTLVSRNWLSKLQGVLATNRKAATIVPTEIIKSRNILKEFYTNKLSQSELIAKLITYSPLRMLRGKGLSLPREHKPHLVESNRQSLEAVDRLNSKIERKYKDKVTRLSYVSTGYCLLARKSIKDDVVNYLHNFNTLFPVKSIDYWNEISQRKNIEHLVSQGTYVYHYRGGSGGY